MVGDRALAVAVRAKARRDDLAGKLADAEDAYDIALAEAAEGMTVGALAAALGVARWTVTKRVGRHRRRAAA